MSIRRINKYTVIDRFNLSSTLFDQKDIIYIQEVGSKEEESQVVFDENRVYVTDINSEIYLKLRQGFIEPVTDGS